MATDRLVRSREGFLRSMQVSRARYWFFHEGTSDTPFYSTLLERSTYAREQYCLASAGELDSALSGGKTKLAEFYRYLRRRDALQSSLEGDEAIAIFLLDKDLDDVENKKLRSPHVVYTEFYNMENYLYRHGDLRNALVAAADVDHASAEAQIPMSNVDWTGQCAHQWLEWVSFCLVVRRLRIKGIRNFRLPRSLFHPKACGVLDKQLQKALTTAAVSRSGRTSEEVEAAIERARRHVGRFLRNGEHDKVWNGRWYAPFLLDEAKAASGRTIGGLRQFARTVRACLVLTLDFSAPPIRRLIDIINSFKAL